MTEPRLRPDPDPPTNAPLSAVVVPVTPFQQNCTLLWCTKTMRGAAVDPGGETAKLLQVATSKGVTLEKVLLTHGHLDHAGGAAAIKRQLGVPIEGPHKDDLFLLEAIAEQGKRYGMTDAESCLPDRWLENGETVTVGEVTLGVRHCPGHTPGHIVFFNEAAKIALVGDVLFRGSIGRSDFPRGDFNALVKSITERLWPLGDDMRFVPGHGQLSTFGFERKTNPFVSDLALGRD